MNMQALQGIVQGVLGENLGAILFGNRAANLGNVVGAAPNATAIPAIQPVPQPAVNISNATVAGNITAGANLAGRAATTFLPQVMLNALKATGKMLLRQVIHYVCDNPICAAAVHILEKICPPFSRFMAGRRNRQNVAGGQVAPQTVPAAGTTTGTVTLRERRPGQDGHAVFQLGAQDTGRTAVPQAATRQTGAVRQRRVK
jgi:hypothetical protein